MNLVRDSLYSLVIFRRISKKEEMEGFKLLDGRLSSIWTTLYENNKENLSGLTSLSKSS